MSLLHNPIYTTKYTESDDTEGLHRLKWSQFGCKCPLCKVDGGKFLMENQPVNILDQIAREDRMRFDVELAYVCKNKADKLNLSSNDPHRLGLAVKVRMMCPKKRLKLMRGLIVRGVTRIRIARDFFYFDVDELRGKSLYIV